MSTRTDPIDPKQYDALLNRDRLPQLSPSELHAFRNNLSVQHEVDGVKKNMHYHDTMWRRATSRVEVAERINSGLTVFDNDGDWVIGLCKRRPENGDHEYSYAKRTKQPGTNGGLDSWHPYWPYEDQRSQCEVGDFFVLLRDDARELTQDDVEDVRAALLASLSIQSELGRS